MCFLCSSEKLLSTEDDDKHRDPKLVKVQRRDLEMPGPKWNICIKLPPAKAQESQKRGQNECKNKRWLMPIRKQCLHPKQSKTEKTALGSLRVCVCVCVCKHFK